MTVTLPAGSGSSNTHNAFPGIQPTIVRFEDKVSPIIKCCDCFGNKIFAIQVEVLASLQRPKKITACASDGKWYILLCKPKVCNDVHTCTYDTYGHVIDTQDDLRKDARLMEFNSVINKVNPHDVWELAAYIYSTLAVCDVRTCMYVIETTYSEQWLKCTIVSFLAHTML